MPTGYTDPVYSGDPIDATELAQGFARGMGFTIHQRDESPDSPPRKRVPSKYYEEQVARLERERKHLLGLKEPGLKKEFEAHVSEVNAYNEDTYRKWTAMRQRYAEAIRVFRSWQPRTEAGAGVKKFALSQLTEAKDFDASPRGPYTMEPIGDTPDAYLTAKLAENARSLDRARESLYDEQERCENTNRWIDDFYSDVKLLDGIRLNDETVPLS